MVYAFDVTYTGTPNSVHYKERRLMITYSLQTLLQAVGAHGAQWCTHLMQRILVLQTLYITTKGLMITCVWLICDILTYKLWTNLQSTFTLESLMAPAAWRNLQANVKLHSVPVR